MFKHYAFLRAWTGLDEAMPPNNEILPILEEVRKFVTKINTNDSFQFARPHTLLMIISLSTLIQTVFQCLPHRILASHCNTTLDILAAIPYLIHFPLPFLFGIYLAFSPQKRRFVYTFFWLAGWVNFLAGIVQFDTQT